MIWNNTRRIMLLWIIVLFYSRMNVEASTKKYEFIYPEETGQESIVSNKLKVEETKNTIQKMDDGYNGEEKFNDKIKVNFILQVFSEIGGKYQYSESNILGTGGSATVYRGIDKNTREAVAIKKIPKNQIKQAEIDIMTKLVDHENIITLKDVIDTPSYKYIVTNLCSGGELFDKIAKDDRFDEGSAKRYLREILRAVDYMHKQGIIHRDLKPENILLEKNSTNAIPQLKIIDFGMAYDLVKKRGRLTGGTTNYMAPEEHGIDICTEKVDVWSMGVMLYIFLSGNLPFTVKSQYDLDQILQAKFHFPSPSWDNISDEAKDLVTKMLTVDVNKRIQLDEIQEHRWWTQKEEPEERFITITMSADTESPWEVHPDSLKIKKLSIRAYQQGIRLGWKIIQWNGVIINKYEDIDYLRKKFIISGSFITFEKNKFEVDDIIQPIKSFRIRIDGTMMKEDEAFIVTHIFPYDIRITNVNELNLPRSFIKIPNKYLPNLTLKKNGKLGEQD